MNDAERIAEMRQLLTQAEKTIAALNDHITQLSGSPEEAKGDSQSLHRKAKSLNVVEEDRIIEGVFDGQNMIGPDGKQYPVPANYASKSKLVEGDVMKLTITDDGSFIYKQIGPIDRRKVIGKIVKDGAEWRGLADGKYYRILLASITFYKAEEGDEVVLILPKGREATWGTVENVIKAGQSPTLEEDEPFADEEEEEVELMGATPEDNEQAKEEDDEFSLTF